MIRVAIVDAYPHVLGGAHTVHRDIARAGQSSGAWQATVIFPEAGIASTWLAHSGVQVSVVNAPTALLAYGGSWTARIPLMLIALPRWWRRLARDLRGFDVVHLSDLRGFFLGAPAALLARRPMLFHVHNGESGGQVWNAFAWLLLRTRLTLVAPSRRGAESWVGARGAEVVQIPNAVGTRPARVEGEVPSVVCVARVHPDKGLDTLLSSVGLLERRGHALRVRIVGPVGSGFKSYATALRARAEQLGDVEFVGLVDDPSPYYEQAWVYVQPSRKEPFGLAALEASASRLPVVATSVGGLVDVVSDGATGVLIAPDDELALADALERLLTDEALRDKMGGAGQDRAVSEFGEAAFAERMKTLYEGLVR